MIHASLVQLLDIAFGNPCLVVLGHDRLCVVAELLHEGPFVENGSVIAGRGVKP